MSFSGRKELTFSKIFVLGAGAIGSVLGAVLSKNYDVTLIGSKAHVEAVNIRGLSVSGDINGIFHLNADTEIRKIPEKTLILLTTKAHDSAKAIERIKSLLRDDTVILILQNGIGNEEVVEKAAGKEIKVLRGVLKMAAEFVEPGVIRFWQGRTIIGRDKVGEQIAEMFNRCSLEAKVSEDMEKEIWKKLVVNCVVNPLTAILRVPDGEIITNSLKRLRDEIVRECLSVARAEGVILAPDLADRIDRSVAGYANFSSMYQDVVKGKETEIDFLNGKIVELGKRHGIPTPVNETLVSLIKFLEGQDGV
jgi:2-dehydropantoate 2-reductase